MKKYYICSTLVLVGCSAIQSLGGGDGGVIDEIENANNGSILEIDVIAFPGVIDQTSVLEKITEMNRILREDADISTSDLPCCLEFKLGTFYRQKNLKIRLFPKRLKVIRSYLILQEAN
ncbi:hypothetical protein KKB55_08180 [Myxococcota bacterium]|nr:hypothetical protein [Myxococcota bacterium]